MKLWSYRNSPARGAFWHAERDVTPDTAEGWLTVFRQDEPGVTFVLAEHKPRHVPSCVTNDNK